MTEPNAHTLRLRVHDRNVDAETLAAVVVALSASTSTVHAPAEQTVPAWQLAGMHESRSDLRIIRPQQLRIRGNKQW